MIDPTAGLLICAAAFIFLFLFVLASLLLAGRPQPEIDKGAVNLCAFQIANYHARCWCGQHQ